MSTPIDVVVPIHNAPEATRRCVESVLESIGSGIGRLHLCDDASDPETAEMLDGLADPRLVLHHARANHGFGRTVNRGISRTETPTVLVLNSDVWADSDFLTPLADALTSDRGLAAVTPRIGPLAAFDGYQRRAGVIPTFTFRGFAFLVRRRAFDAVGGFDATFGRGYYEDTDLSRRFGKLGFRMGVVPDSVVHHEGHASFGQTADSLALRSRNRELYLERYPEARSRILLVSGRLSKPPDTAIEAAREAVLAGGALDWLSRSPHRDVPAVEIRLGRHELLRTARRILRKRRREPQRYTALWLAGSLGPEAAILRALARGVGIEVRSIPDGPQP